MYLLVFSGSVSSADGQHDDKTTDSSNKVTLNSLFGGKHLFHIWQIFDAFF